MNDSKGSVVVGDQGAADVPAELVVVPDRRGEGEQALGDPGADAGDGAAAVAFQVELAFQGVVDRFDDLAQRFEEAFAGSGRFAPAGGPEQGDPGLVEFGFERGAVVVLVADQDLPGLSGQAGGAGEDVGQGVAFVGFGAGQRPADRQPVHGADQMQPQSP